MDKGENSALFPITVQGVKHRIRKEKPHKSRGFGPTSVLSQGNNFSSKDLAVMWKLQCLGKPYKTGKAGKLTNREDLLFISILLLTCFCLAPEYRHPDSCCVSDQRPQFFLGFSPQFLTQQSFEGCSPSSPDCWDCNSIPKDLKRLPEKKLIAGSGEQGGKSKLFHNSLKIRPLFILMPKHRFKYLTSGCALESSGFKNPLKSSLWWFRVTESHLTFP